MKKGFSNSIFTQMFLIKESGYTSESPFYMTLPAPSDDVKEKIHFFFPEKKTGDWFYEKGFNERPLILWAIDNFIKEDKNFIDIGAHIGSYTLLAGKKAKHTYSFECSPKTFCYLCANLALQNMEYKVNPYSVALGPSEGEIEYMIRSEDGGGNGVKSLERDTVENPKKILVPMRTLDSYKIRDVSLIKIDVEGFEKEVLQGSVETLQESGYPPILFESWNPGQSEENARIQKELIEFLESLDYRVKAIIGVNEMYIAIHK